MFMKSDVVELVESANQHLSQGSFFIADILFGASIIIPIIYLDLVPIRHEGPGAGAAKWHTSIDIVDVICAFVGITFPK